MPSLWVKSDLQTICTYLQVKSPPGSGGFIRREPPNKKTDKTGVPVGWGGLTPAIAQILASNVNPWSAVGICFCTP
jgi:hypothetical protein